MVSQKVQIPKAPDWQKVLVLLCIAAVSYCMTEIVEVKVRFSALEASAVTQCQLQDLKDDLPPTWFKERVAAIEKTVQESKVLIHALDQKLDERLDKVIEVLGGKM